MASNIDTQLEVGKFLLGQGKITQVVFDRLVEESKKQGKSFLDLLISLKEVDEEEVAQARSKILEIPYVNLRSRSIQNDVLQFVPQRVAQNFQVISFEKKTGVVSFALVDPENFKAIEMIEFLTRSKGIKYSIFIMSQASYEASFEKYKTLKTEVGEFIEQAEVAYEADQPEEEDNLSSQDVEKIVQEAPIAKAVDVIMTHAVDGRASDVHIEPLENDTRVRYRVDGILHTSLSFPKKIHPAIVARIKVLAKLKIDERRLPQDGRFEMSVSGKKIDVRVSTLPVSTGEKVVMRVLDKSDGLFDLKELGLSDTSIEVIERSIREPYGMFLITGPTGSGKSTTLYAALLKLNKEGVNIITMEDPVEYYIEGVNQSQVRPDIGLTFASGLRSILRQDPDVVMVGEIRDAETAEMAVHAALTGHFLLSTLHTNSAVGAIPRLLDMGIEPFLLTASLTALAAQRLVRRICDDCKEEVELTEEYRVKLQQVISGMPEAEKQKIALNKLTVYKGAGCQECVGQGYRGRVGIYEVLEIDDSIKHAIIENKTEDEIFDVARSKQQMLTMEEDGVLKVLSGLTTVEEILRVV